MYARELIHHTFPWETAPGVPRDERSDRRREARGP